jgi:hypothetical protein
MKSLLFVLLVFLCGSVLSQGNVLKYTYRDVVVFKSDGNVSYKQTLHSSVIDEYSGNYQKIFDFNSKTFSIIDGGVTVYTNPIDSSEILTNGLRKIYMTEEDIRNGSKILTTHIIDEKNNMSYYTFYWDNPNDFTLVIRESILFIE